MEVQQFINFDLKFITILKEAKRDCKLFLKEVSYLGHTIRAKEIKTDADKIEAVVNLPHPNTEHKLRSYLGFCTSVSSKKNVSVISRPYRQLKKVKRLNN